MTLRYKPLDVELPLSEGTVQVLSVERPDHFSKMLLELQKAADGEPSEWMLSNSDGEQKIAKNLEFIWNPLIVDLNEKKLLNALYKELEGYVLEDLFDDYSLLNSKTVDLLDKLTMMVPYPLTFDLENSVPALLKQYQLRFESDSDRPAELLMNYMSLVRQIKHINGFVLLNLKQFYPREELRELYIFAEYEKLRLLVLEGYHSKALPKESNWILDKDLCTIKCRNTRITATVRGETR